MAYEIRALTTDDNAAAFRLGSVAFGYHHTPMPEGFAATADGRTSWGVFEGGALLAKAVDRVQGQWFGGRVVPASGVAGVAVIPEVRDGGLGRTVLTRLLWEARNRGAAISTLFPSTPFPYRALGWEEVGALTYYGIPTAALAARRDTSPSDVRLRPATKDDIPAMEKLYRDMARASTGMMERTGPLFPALDWIEDFDGVSVALGPGGDVTGYASWDRGKGPDDGKITVYDLISQDTASMTALRRMFAAWASVAPRTVLRVTPPDPVLYSVASSSMDIERRSPWMLRLVDAAAAVAARGWPAYQSGVVDLKLADAECEWNAGPYRLVIDGGDARLEPGGSGLVAFTPRGLAAWFAGTATPAVLRRAGLMSGGDARSDAFLQSATAGPAPALHDYF